MEKGNLNWWWPIGTAFMILASSEEARPDTVPVPDQGTVTVPQQVVTVKKRTHTGAKVIIALIVLIIASWQLWLFRPIRDYKSRMSTTVPLNTFGGTVGLRIAGRGLFYIAHVSVALGHGPCEWAVPTSASLTLPQEFGIQVECTLLVPIASGPIATTTLVVRIDGTWSPFGNVQIPVSVSSELPVESTLIPSQ
jgi:hypothetical protein